VIGLLVALAVLAWGFRTVPGDAREAKAALVRAKDAVAAGDVEAARTNVDAARQHSDALQDSVQGVAGDVWSVVPVAGGAVRDLRHLGDAMEQLVRVAEIGVEAWPRLDDPDHPLMEDERIDLPAMAALTEDLGEADDLMRSAQASLVEVDDSRLVVGTRLADARDEALEVLDPLTSAVASARPAIDKVPQILGAEGRQVYLVAMLNQAEQRHSGGAPLTLATLTAEDGRVDMSEPIDGEDPETFQRLNWKKVRGNSFHRPDSAISGANYAPSWPVSGKEMARAWQQLRGQRVDGIIAVDVTALADLLRLTGPVEAPGYGTLSADMLVQSVIGNYDAYDEDQLVRKQLNRALVPVFSDQVLTSAKLPDKMRSLRASADGRHVAVWMRDPDLQAAMAQAGLDGDLSDTEHDYLMVSNQNVNAAKSDYWQERSARAVVRLADDGSARVRLQVDVHNDSPPWTLPYPDPGGSSFVTRTNGMALVAFLPKGAEVRSMTLDGEARDPWVGRYFGRTYARVDLLLAAQERARWVVTYRVPSAAVVGEDGSLTYRLDLDPHSLVRPDPIDVEVRFPDGMRVAGELADGWSAEGSTATYSSTDITKSEAFTVTAEP
jgi:hypothetical protein